MKLKHASLHHRDQDRLCQWVKGAATHWQHCSFPRIVVHHPKERPPLRWWVLQWEKSTKWRSNSPSMWVTSWEPPFQSHLIKISGQSSGLDDWELDCDKNTGEGLAIISTWIFENKVPPWTTQVVVPASCFAHLQSQNNGMAWPRNSAGCRPTWYVSLNEGHFVGLVGLGAWSVSCLGGEANTRELNHS